MSRLLNYESFQFTKIFNLNKSNKMTIKFLTFGGGGQRYRDAAARLGGEAKNTGLFNEIFALSEADLGSKIHAKFYKKFQKFLEENKRGFGYWLWKPYLISWAMQNMADGDILVYADSGCEFGSLEKIKKVFSELEKKNNKSLVFNRAGVYGYGDHAIKPFCSSITLKALDPHGEIQNELMQEATVLAIKVEKITREFIADWFDSCSHTEYLIDPLPANEPPGFIDHRHDQAIFSLLMRSKYPVLLNGDMSGVWSEGIVPKRKRHGKVDNYFRNFTKGVYRPIGFDEFKEIAFSSEIEAWSKPEDGKNLVTFDLHKAGFNCHTKPELNPSIVFKFKDVTPISAILIENREGYESRISSMLVESFDANGAYIKLCEFNFPFGGFYDESPLIFNLPYGFKTNQIKLSVINTAEESLHLRSVYFYS